MDTTNTAYEQRIKALFQEIARLRVEGKEILAQAERVLTEARQEIAENDAKLEATPKLTCLQLTEAYAQLQEIAAIKPLRSRASNLLKARVARLGFCTDSDESRRRACRLYSRLQLRIDEIAESINEAAYIQLYSIDPTLPIYYDLLKYSRD